MSEVLEHKDAKMKLIKNEIDHVLKELDTINPETAGVAEIDKIINMLDQLENKCRTIRETWD